MLLKKQIGLILILIAIFFVQGYSTDISKNAGTTGANFLKIGIGGRPTGMGGAYSSISDDIFATYYNPAGLTQIKNNNIAFQHMIWMADFNQDYIGYGKKINHHYIAVSSLLFRSGEIKKTLESIYGTFYGFDGTFNTSEGYIKATYSYKILNKLSAGLNLGYIFLRYDDKNAYSFATDIGLLYNVMKNIKMSLVMKNLGTGIKFINESYQLPFEVTLGSSIRLLNKTLLISLDITQPIDNKLIYKAGIEYKLIDMLYFRVGYNNLQDINYGYSCGMGIRYQTLNFDYSIRNFNPIGLVHNFSFITQF